MDDRIWRWLSVKLLADTYCSYKEIREMWEKEGERRGRQREGEETKRWKDICLTQWKSVFQLVISVKYENSLLSHSVFLPHLHPLLLHLPTLLHPFIPSSFVLLLSFPDFALYLCIFWFTVTVTWTLSLSLPLSLLVILMLNFNFLQWGPRAW